jgi:hypothetical protein
MSIQSIIQDNQDDLAFLVGNGVNRYAFSHSKNSFSWEQILRSLWQEVSDEPIDVSFDEISFTEFFDILELLALKKGLSSNLLKNEFSLQQKFCDHLNQMPKPHQVHQDLVKVAKKFQIPVLTTNMDEQLSNAGNCELFKIKNQGFTDFYPWSTYFADKALESPVSGYGIWHVNGLQRYFRSVRLGLTHYVGSIARARRLMHASSKTSYPLYHKKGRVDWGGKNTWLDILFHKPLLIFGLALDTNETFLRWLLIERAKYFHHFKNLAKPAWYVEKCNSNRDNKDKKLFLETVGIRYIQGDSYESLYGAFS